MRFLCGRHYCYVADQMHCFSVYAVITVFIVIFSIVTVITVRSARAALTQVVEGMPLIMGGGGQL